MSQRDDLIQIFIAETNELIEELDQSFVRMESEPDDQELVAAIFRATHTLKGNSGLVGMTNFERIAHKTEEVLTEIRDGKRKIEPDVVNFLLDSLDQLKVLFATIQESGHDQVDLPEIPVPGEVAVKDSAGKKAAGKTSKRKAARRTKAKGGPARKTSVRKKKQPAAAGDGASVETAWEVFPEDTADAPAEAVAEDESWGLFDESLSDDSSSEAVQEIEAETKCAEPSAIQSATTSPPVERADTTIRVDVTLLDGLMNMVGELVLARNQILQFTKEVENSHFQAASQRLDLCTSELQERIMQTRLQPISNVFNRFPRVVHDITRVNNKDVKLTLEGAETELDKTIIEGIRDPLTHLVRNAIDHGIEDEDTRQAAGKSTVGALTLRAFHEGGQVNIEVIDDGSGIDPGKVKAKAVEKGVMTQQQVGALSDREAIALIFKPGFSTAEKVTKLSGRGVGMDVVKTNIEKVGGNIEIASELGQGTTIKIKIPLTLAIIPALVISSGGQKFFIPQVNLLELVRLEGEAVKQIEEVGDAEIYRLRGKLLPILRLSKVLNLSSEAAAKDDVNIVVLAAGETKFGLIVDKIHDTEEIVVKPLSKYLTEVQAFAGATVMGDGKAALILDVVGLAGLVEIPLNEPSDMTGKTGTDEKRAVNQTYLLFSVSDREQLALPLALVSRLERTDYSALQKAGKQDVIQYHGKILPLLRVEQFIDIAPPAAKETAAVIVFSVEKNEVGFLVSHIIGIEDCDAKLDTSSSQQPGILGSLIVDGKITLVVDAFALIQSQFPEWFRRRSDFVKTKQSESVSRILVVDDSPFIRAIERSYLESAGFTVVEANDGEEALARMTTESVDMIITDLEMPKMDGLELTRTIRANESLKELPIVAVTSPGSSADDLKRGLEAGVDAFLNKVDREELISTLEQVIDSSN